MKNTDLELIQQILADDESAFEELVNRYKKQVHALAWRKIGDFQIAEEITQDAFLKVFQELHALKDPNLFSGWLYVITANLCATWHRKKRIQTQPLEDEEIMMQDKDIYSQHVVEERARTAADTHREVVKKLLAKLKESERTVMTLHYLGEMTVEEISKFIGVSAGTIKSRLQRARNRLQKEEHMIREALEHFQISPNLTDDILTRVSRIKPAAPTSKPLIPWVAAASSAVLIMLMLGIGSQFLAYFQKPYSFDAQSEMMVELIDTPIVLNLDMQSNEQNQFGSANAIGENDNSGQNPDEVLLLDGETEGENISIPKREWIEYERQSFVFPSELLATPEGELYTLSTGGHLYKLGSDGDSWEHINDMSSIKDNFMDGVSLIAEWNGILYMVWHNEFYASKDDGKTWNLVYKWEIPAGERDWEAQDLVLTEQFFYLVYPDAAYRSDDQGKTWKDMRDELPDVPESITVLQDTVFVESETELYRGNGGSWQKLTFPVPESVSVFSVVGSKNRLYAMAILEDFDPHAASEGRQRTWWVFRSTDLGNTWKDITPTNAWPIKGWHPDINLIAAGENILLMEKGMVMSTDGGDTWLPPVKPNASPSMNSYSSPAVVLNDRIIYVGGDGFQRSKDGGKTWERIEIPARRKFSRSIIEDLIVYDDIENAQETDSAVYAKYWRTLDKTTDKGKSWNSIEKEVPMTEPFREDQPQILSIVKSDDGLYAKGGSGYDVEMKINLYKVSEDGNSLIGIQGFPNLHSHSLWHKVSRHSSNPLALSDTLLVEELQKNYKGATQFFKELVDLTQGEVVDFGQGGLPSQLIMVQHSLIERGFNGTFAVSGDTFYLEYNFKLFRWTQGERELYDTGVEETVGLTIRLPDGRYLPALMAPAETPKGQALKKFRVLYNLKLAVSGDTVYVGKRDGHLLVSYDRGENWTDITERLPLTVIAFKDIKFVGSKVYVATDAGVAVSNSGTKWDVITDAEGTELVLEYLTVDNRRLFGMTDKTGVYLLVNGTWEQVVSETPERATSFAVDGNILYVSAMKRGMLHYVLE